MDDYVFLALTSSLVPNTVVQMISLLLLVLARLTPIIALAPFFGAKILPHPTKVALAISLFVIFLPQLLLTITTPLAFNIHLMLLIVKEMFIGTAMGFMVGLPFFIAQNAGVIVDHQRGGASLMVNDPTIQNQSSPLGTLNNLVFIFIFFFVNGPILFIEVISESYSILPPDKFLSYLFWTGDSPFWVTIIHILNKMMVLSVQLASPGLVMLLMTSVFLGIANRLAPQVQITFLGLPLKSLLALTVICFGWKAFSKYLGEFGLVWIHTMREFIQTFAIGT